MTTREPVTDAAAAPTTAERVVVVHGYAAHTGAHWFPWLHETLGARGVAVDVVELPDPQRPDAAAWAEAVGAAVGEVGPGTHLVGHSLGCVTVLRHLARRTDDWRLGGLVLVAGFGGPLAVLPQLDAFLQAAPTDDELGAVAARTARRLVVRSDDDATVPAAASDLLAARLDAAVLVVPGGGHFLGREGHLQLPAVLEAIPA